MIGLARHLGRNFRKKTGTCAGSKKLILTHLRGSRTYFTYSIGQRKKETTKNKTKQNKKQVPVAYSLNQLTSFP